VRTRPPPPGSALALKHEQALAQTAAEVAAYSASVDLQNAPKLKRSKTGAGPTVPDHYMYGADDASTTNAGVSAADHKTTVVVTERRTKRSAAVQAEKAFKDIDKKPKIPKKKEWLEGVGVGSNLEARDASNVDPLWYKAKVVDADGEKLKIHYHGFAQRFDQWMERDLAYLQPAGSRSKPTQKIRSSTKDKVVEKPQSKRPRMQASAAASPISANGEPSDIIGDTAAISIGNYRLKIALLDPPRVMIRDMISFVCELTDVEGAALNIKSLASKIQCVASTFSSSYRF
jgi:hypothetical protein